MPSMPSNRRSATTPNPRGLQPLGASRRELLVQYREHLLKEVASIDRSLEGLAEAVGAGQRPERQG